MNGMKLIRITDIHKLKLQYKVKETNIFTVHICIILIYTIYDIFFILVCYQPQSMHHFKSTIELLLPL